MVPFARYGHSAVYSRARSALLVHGGAHVNRVNHRVGLLAHTAAYAVRAGGYSELVPSDVRAYHPPPRSEHSAVLHTLADGHELMVVYGGRGNGLDWVRGDTLLFDVARIAWRVSAPGRNCSGHAAVLHDGQMFTFGGWDGRGYFYHDLAVFDIAREQWSTPPTTGGPPARRRHASVVPVRHGHEPAGHASYALLFGGFTLREDAVAAAAAAEAAARASYEDEHGEWQDTREKIYVDGLWRLDFDTLSWSLLIDTSSDGVAPPRLFWPSAFFHYDADEQQHSIVVYGGALHESDSEAEADVYRLLLTHCGPGVGGPDCKMTIDCSEVNECGGDRGVWSPTASG